MLFNSLEFVVFLPIVFCLYWLVGNKSLRLQNIVVLAASYFFYGWWDWRFLSLIVCSSAADYLVGRGMESCSEKRKRKALLTLSLVVNLGFLGFFKYFDFFVENFVASFTLLGLSLEASTLNIILPVGISFYTFQTLSYSIDVYRGKLEAERDPLVFFTFVAFFPQLVAGPIERATNLLPQFHKARAFDYDRASDGMRQILWGLFKKITVADNCAIYVNEIFASADTASGSTLLVGALLFTFQIYGDFSGYSDIAIGTSRLFGFDLMKNFAFPYFSRDIAEFWRRWHISLSSWFRDYLYIPLGGSKGGTRSKLRNTFIIFLVSGFWHGANWTFIVWGFVNALYFVPLMLFGKNRTHLDTVAAGRLIPTFYELIQMLTTFAMTVIAWIFFRSENVTAAIRYLDGLFSSSLFSAPSITAYTYLTFGFIFILLCVEWLQRSKEHGLEFLDNEIAPVFRWPIYAGVVLLISVFGSSQQTFIYFQF